MLHIVSEGTWVSHLRRPFLVVLMRPTTMVGFLCLNITSILCTYRWWCEAADFRSRSSHLMLSSSSPISCPHSQPLDEQLRGLIFRSAVLKGLRKLPPGFLSPGVFAFPSITLPPAPFHSSFAPTENKETSTTKQKTKGNDRASRHNALTNDPKW